MSLCTSRHPTVHTPLPPTYRLTMEDEHYDRKIFCALKAAMMFKSKSCKFWGSLEFAWYELLIIYLSKLLRRYQTLSFSAQYCVCSADRDPDSKTRDVLRIPDFAILRSLSDVVEGNFSFDSRFILAVVEAKPIKFDWIETQTIEEVTKLSALTFHDAIAQAKVQAKFVFANSIQQTVFAMHVVGPFWNYLIYDRDSLSPFRRGVDDVSYVKKHRIVTLRPNISKTVRIGTAESDELFETMLSEMRASLAIGNLPF